jgi:hypothetical protein
MPANKGGTIRESLMILNQAFLDHCSMDERTFASLHTSLSPIQGMNDRLIRIEDGLNGEKIDIARMQTTMSDTEKRLRALERWRWGLMGGVPILTILGLMVLRHVFNIQF